jgi:DNA-binding PadR family transcriptional regulator
MNSTYRPRYRSGAYAILLALYDAGLSSSLTKEELIQLASPLSVVSFLPKTKYSGHIYGSQNHSYTAWSAMSELVKKRGLVSEKWSEAPRKKLYSLTQEGMEVAAKLSRTQTVQTNPSNISQKQSRSPIRTQPQLEKDSHFQKDGRILELECEDDLQFLEEEQNDKTITITSNYTSKPNNNSLQTKEGERESNDDLCSDPPPATSLHLTPDKLNEYRVVLLGDKRENMFGGGPPILNQIRLMLYLCIYIFVF